MAVVPVASNQTVNTALEQALVTYFPALSPLQLFFVIAAVSLVLAKVLELAGARFASAVVRRTDSSLDDTLFEELHAPIYITVAVIGFYIATIPLGVPLDLDKLLRAGMLTAILLIWMRTFIRTGNQFFAHIKESEKNHDFAHIFENIWTFLIVIAGLFGLLAVWNIDITPLIASAGVAGVVIGFAAKDAVANLFGGFALYFDDTYTIGDFIVLDSGESGTVVDIGIRSTTIVTRDEVMITIPNSVLNSAMVINQSHPQERKRISVPVGVAYGTDIDEFEDLVTDIAEDEGLVLGHPAPRMRFREFGESSLNYELQCWVEAPLNDVKAQHKLNREIYKALNAANIEIPYPKRDVYMRQEAAETAREQEQEEVKSAEDETSDDGADR